MPAHIYGHAHDIERTKAIARSKGLYVVEDAAQACGVTFNGKHAGTFGDIGIYSLFSDKVITAGEGGVLLTNSDELYEKIKLLRNQGRPNAGTFIHPALGMNFRITDMQAAVAHAQLEKLPSIVQERMQKWDMYFSKLNGVGDLQFMSKAKSSNLVPFRFPLLTTRKTS